MTEIVLEYKSYPAEGLTQIEIMDLFTRKGYALSKIEPVKDGFFKMTFWKPSEEVVIGHNISKKRRVL